MNLSFCLFTFLSFSMLFFNRAVLLALNGHLIKQVILFYSNIFQPLMIIMTYSFTIILPNVSKLNLVLLEMIDQVGLFYDNIIYIHLFHYRKTILQIFEFCERSVVFGEMGTLKSVCSSWFAPISRDKYEHTLLRVPIFLKHLHQVNQKPGVKFP